MNLHGVETLFC